MKKRCKFQYITTATLLLLICVFFGGCAGEAAIHTDTASAVLSPAVSETTASSVPPSATAAETSAATSVAPDQSAEASATASASAKASASKSPKSTSSPKAKASAKASASTKPSASPSPSVKPSPSPSPSEKKEDAVITFKGAGLEAETSFSLADIKAMKSAYVDAVYFSRGKDPKEAETAFKGVKLYYILNNVIGLKDNAKSITVTATDGYAASFTLSQVKATYIDETDPAKKLPMILAFEEDNKALTPSGAPLRLVRGQEEAGEYNRLYWVRNIKTIEVKAG